MNTTAFPDVGAILKKARESQGLSVQEAADALHLRPSIVIAIECNEFSEVPGTTFLKGYVKSYARLLKLSETEILDHLQQALDIETSVASAATVPDISKSRLNYFGVFLLITILIFGAGFYSWQAGYIIVSSEGGLTIQFSSQPETKNVLTAPGEESLPRGAVIEPRQDVSRLEVQSPGISSRPASGTEQNVSTITSNNSSQIATEVSPSPDTTALPTKEVESAVIDGNESFSNMLTSSSAADNVDVEMQEVTASQSEITTEDAANDASYVSDYPNTADESTLASDNFDENLLPGPVEIIPEKTMPGSGGGQPRRVETQHTGTEINEIEKNSEVSEMSNNAIPSIESITGEIVATFSGDCWFQVKNGDGKVVLAALKHSGDTASYSGVLPFQVVIGAVSEVQLTFNGDPVDFNRFRVWNNRTDFILE